MATFLRDTNVLAADVIAVQEPRNNERQHTTHQPATATFQLIYPPKAAADETTQGQDGQVQTSDVSQPGVWLFASKRHDPSTWLIRAETGQVSSYTTSTIGRVAISNTLRHLRNELSKRPHGAHITLGDMDAHHPRWGGTGTRADQEADQLLEIANEWGLELTTQQGRHTWSRNDYSLVIDLTFVTSNLVYRLFNCERAHDIEHASDHFPIRTVLEIVTPIAVQQKRRNWNATDDQKLIQKIEGGLQAGGPYQADAQRIEAKCLELMGVIQSAIEESTPWAKPSAWSNPDFDDECKVSVKGVRRLRRKHTRTKGPHDWICYSEARNKKTRLVKNTLSRARRRRVQQVIEDKGPQVEQKAEAFRIAFFPKQPPADLSDADSFLYPQQIEFPAVTAQEIQDAVRGAKAGKAPGEDETIGHFVPWVRAFLGNRSTRIPMSEGTSDRIPTPTGIPRGSPISPILYLIYNADLIENCGNEEQRTRTIKKLRAACRKVDHLAKNHASVFDPKKYALVHF
ncbi:reverse transcriptase [Penicillium italicum]|uniref:Reverse transcriptase n=1 Tax=Penicillium italicum TaxID=40296 RepID=A0A0A2L1H8_PENIT|nr:reverse transcriptase [Penicillium italicum]